jgi:hypothetical protein
MVVATAMHVAAEATPTTVVATTIELMVCTEAEHGWHEVSNEYCCEILEQVTSVWGADPLIHKRHVSL